MNFKEDVEFYLKNNKGFDYYGFDIENGSIAEGDDSEEEISSDSDASVKTKGKCGASVKCDSVKTKGKCGASVKCASTKTKDCQKSECASTKTKDCQKSECDASMKTGTHGEEDDDGWHASTDTTQSNCSSSSEEVDNVKLIKLIKKNGGLGHKFVPETPEEKEMLRLAAKIAGSKAAVKDDHTAGFAPSIETKKSIKEEILSKL